LPRHHSGPDPAADIKMGESRGTPEHPRLSYSGGAKQASPCAGKACA